MLKTFHAALLSQTQRNIVTASNALVNKKFQKFFFTAQHVSRMGILRVWGYGGSAAVEVATEQVHAHDWGGMSVDLSGNA